MEPRPGGHPREAEGEKTREEILEVALKLFSKQGYKETTISQIAEGAATYRSSVDWHFGGKEGLLLAVVEYYLERRLVEDVQKTWRSYETSNPGAGAAEMMDFFVFATGQTLERHLPVLIALFTLAFEQTHKNPALAEKIRNFWSTLISTLAAVIQLGAAKGIFRDIADPQWTAKSLVALCQGLFMQWYVDPASVAPEDALKHIQLATTKLLNIQSPHAQN